MLGWLAYLIVSVVWGSTFLAIAFAVKTFTPWGLSAARYIPAALLVLAWGRLRRERLPTLAELPRILLVGVLLLGVCMTLVAWAEGQVGSGLASCIAATVPLFLGLLDPTGLGRRGWAGLGLGFLGVVVLLWPAGSLSAPPRALALVLSSFVWAFGTLLGKRHGGQAGHFTKVGLEMLAAGLLALAVAPLAGGFLRGPVEGRALAALAYLILFGSIVAYSAYIHLAQVWPVSRAGTYAYWNPVVAVLLGCGAGGEAFHGRTVPGLAIVLLGVALVQMPRRREPEPGTIAPSAVPAASGSVTNPVQPPDPAAIAGPGSR